MKAPRAVLWGTLGWHPAVQAWSGFVGCPCAPERIEVLRKGKHSATYRVAGVGPEGESIIAQRTPRSRASIERTVYEHILPRLPVTTPRYYGSKQEDRAFVWLFFQDVGDARWSPSDPVHLTLAGRWLGRMHTAATQVGAARRLPDGGPSRYLDHLRGGRHTMRVNLANEALGPDDVELLTRLIATLDALEGGWDRLEHACSGVPRTLVHGDFQRKNAYVRSGAHGLELFAIDWEMAGWGVPAVDLTKIDLETYWSVVTAWWPELRIEDLRRLAAVGRIFEQLCAVHWVSPELSRSAALYLRRPMSWLRVFEGRLAEAIRDLGGMG